MKRIAATMRTLGRALGEDTTSAPSAEISPVENSPLAVADRARDARDWPAAADAYRAALDLEPDRADLWVQLGHALKEDGDVTAAEAAYRQALSIAPDKADTHLQMGHLFNLTHRQEAAARAYARALELDPDFLDAARQLGMLLRAGLTVGVDRAPPAETATSSDREGGQRYFTLAPDLGLTRLTDGHFLYVDPADDAVAAHLIARGYWEAWIHRAVTGLIRPGDHVVEVGANFGYYTVAMARAVGEAGSVTTFEANPALASLVTRSVHFNGYSPRVRVVGKAAADAPRTLTFAVSRRNAGGGSISTDAGGLGPDSRLIEVEAVRLDDVCDQDVRVIRMDAEGSEPLILAGAVRLLQRPDIVVCMEWDVVQMGARGDMRAFVDWLASMGFRFWRIGFDSALHETPAEAMPTLAACDVVLSRHLPPGAVLPID